VATEPLLAKPTRPISQAMRVQPSCITTMLQVHPYFEGLPVTCSGLNINGCYDGATWTVNRYEGLCMHSRERFCQ
jgi:hypothetical protein